MTAMLVVLNKRFEESGRRIPLTPPAQTIGRNLKCDIVIDKNDLCLLEKGGSNLVKVSRTHTKFSQIGERWIIADSGSTNGTSVNFKPIDQNKVELFDTDIIGLGGIVYFKFREDDAS